MLAFCVLAFAWLAVSGLVESAESDPARPASATVTVGPAARIVLPIPHSWLGLSTEYSTLPLFAQHEVAFERFLGLLRVRGGGRLVLRIGGDSADHSFWRPNGGRLPPWAFSLTRRWTESVSGLVRRLGLRLILDLNLITAIPDAALAWARAAVAHLPAHSVIGFEIGNEPDIYSHQYWSVITRGAMVDGRRLPAALTPARYAAEFGFESRALGRIAPGVGVLGPALARPETDNAWVQALVRARPPGLAAVSVHRYPYTACARRRLSAAFPTVDRLLSQAAVTGIVRSVDPALHAAQRARLPLRLTELNSVTCGGRPGVSNSFATALWLPDALFALLRDGIRAVDLHVRANTINAPFALGPRGLVARPLFYGMLLFTRALGAGAGLVSTHVQVRPRLGLAAWTVRAGRRLRLVLVNTGPRAIRVRAVLPPGGQAVVQRLLASSPRAVGGVTLDGQRLDRFGHWTGRPQPVRVSARHHAYSVLLPRHSAALATVLLSPSAAA
ncbi:MAG: glycosyl hydrolase family 79 C-terminal domain-containing protein [Candidatus Dormibacteria bacterium]